MSLIHMAIRLPDGRIKHHEFPTRAPISLGSYPAHRGVSLDDPNVAPHHAEIRFSANRTIIEDLGTHQGTFVNDVRVRRTRLHGGDAIVLGGTTITVRFTGSTYELHMPDSVVAGTVLEGIARYTSYANEPRENDMWLKLVWRCRHSRRIVDERVVAQVDVDDDPDSDEWSFQLAIPFAPVSFTGSRIEVEWIVILESAPSQADWFQVASKPITVLPGRLPPAKPDALMAKVAYRTAALPRTQLVDGVRSHDAVVEHLDGRAPQDQLLREREVWAAGLVSRARSASLLGFASRLSVDAFDGPWVSFAGDRANLAWTLTSRRRGVQRASEISWRLECVEHFEGARIVYHATGTVDRPTEFHHGQPTQVRFGITIPLGLPGSLRTSSVELFWRVHLVIRFGWLRRTRSTNEFWVVPILPPER